MGHVAGGYQAKLRKNLNFPYFLEFSLLLAREKLKTLGVVE